MATMMFEPNFVSKRLAWSIHELMKHNDSSHRWLWRPHTSVRYPYRHPYGVYDEKCELSHTHLIGQEYCFQGVVKPTLTIQFGRFAREKCARRGNKPETFDFLGFTHFCTTKRNGEFHVGRKTSKKRLVKQIAAVQSSLRQRLHRPPLTTLRWLESVLRGHMNYYSVPGNLSSVSMFRTEIIRRWFKMQRRRSQRKAIVWSWFSGWINRQLPHAKVVHPYPGERFHAKYSQ